ncbi:MAG: acetyltransferase [Sphingomonas bacterium]|nr:acetyltransferase [Sphingomonas bacterium]
MPPTIAPAVTADDLATIRTLFQAYADGLAVDLAYQDFAAELAGLPGKYAAPHGALLLARDAGGAALGCVALRPLGDGLCEMKRLYVATAARGTGLGAALMRAIVTAGRERGYRAMRLDTLADMAAAQAMYTAAGFRPIAPYYHGAAAGTIFLELTL